MHSNKFFIFVVLGIVLFSVVLGIVLFFVVLGIAVMGGWTVGDGRFGETVDPLPRPSLLYFISHHLLVS